MQIAHIRSTDKQIQSLSEHTWNTAKLCSQNCKKIHLENTGYLVGLLHDMGKANHQFETYLQDSVLHGKGAAKGSIHHAPVGAIYAYETWFHVEDTLAKRRTAQILTMVVLAHHSGLPDVFSLDKSSPFLRSMARDKTELCYTESVQNFLTEICDAETLQDYYTKAVAEVEKFCAQMKGLPKKPQEQTDMKLPDPEKSVFYTLLARMVLSCLVDADRWDSACFAYAVSPFEHFEPATPDWQQAYQNLDKHISSFSHSSAIDAIRQEISDACAEAAKTPDKLYRLTVPTGGGKTLASLRFALLKAIQEPTIERIFYCIPYNTVLDQNAKDIQEAVGDTVPILEHHGNVSYDTMSDTEIEAHEKLTERWDSRGIILTSIVQFMNAIYRAENTAARRMHHLSRSIFIFDEIQALPKSCTKLFEIAIDFLIHFCGSTVVLCTATQPSMVFRTTPQDILPDHGTYYTRLKRTRLIDVSRTPISNTEAIEQLVTMVDKYRAVLMIVNTKKEAAQLYEGVKQAGIPAVHLSTNMYPKHRLGQLQKIKNRDPDAKLFCVSTALIEAGINISFPCVIRSLTGLGSILQAAGRCNRHAELPEGTLGDVYIWKLADEKLTHLEEIEACAGIAGGILYNNPEPDSLRSIEKYYENERKYFEKKLSYPIRDGTRNLVSLLGQNEIARPKEIAENLPMCGAYRTAGENFHVIDAVTYSVLVPCDEGEELYRLLSSELSMEDRIRYMRQAGKYSISIYQGAFRHLVQDGIVFPIRDGEMYVLQKEYYNQETGLTLQKTYMDLLFIE